MRQPSILILGASAWLAACGLDADTPLDELETTAGALHDPVVGAVTVHLLGRAMPGGPIVAGMPVLFYTPSGALMGRTTTDASGHATGLVLRGGTVTVVEAAAHQLTTIYDVAPGDVLTVGEPVSWGFEPIGMATLHVPPGPAPSGNQYKVEGPCALSDVSASTALSVLLWPACGTTRPVMATAYQDDLHVLTGYLLDPAVTLVPGGTTALDGTWSPAITFDLALTGIPGSGLNFGLQRFLGEQSVYRFQQGTQFVPDGNLSAQFAQAGGGDGTVTTIDFGWDQYPHGRNTILEYRSGQTTALTGDVSSDFIAHPIDVAWTMDRLSPHGPVGPVGATWAMAGPDAADGMIARIAVIDPEYITAWIAVLPPGTLRYRLPRLPADLVGVWAGRQQESLEVFNVDSPATEYRWFRRDAEPEWPWRWMRAPTTPGKVRIGG